MVREKQVSRLLDEVSLDGSFIMGYYGGGNFGDELLFEVLQHMFYQRKYDDICFLYQKSDEYSRFHRDLGYTPVDSTNKLDILRAVWRQKNIVIGGGGLWGLDVNLNVVLMSVLLFVAKTFFGKDVFLLGVGYYGSTTRMGHIAAWLAGKSATQILARDNETYQRFSKVNAQAYLCDDMAFSLPELDDIDIKSELDIFEKRLNPIDKPTVFISVRRFKPHQLNAYQAAVATWLANNPDQPVIMALMEPRTVDPDGYAFIKGWQNRRPDIQTIDFNYNPVVLYRFFKRHRALLKYIGPQFHVLLVAHLAGVPLMPLVYDNKVSELLNRIGREEQVAISDVTARDIQQFITAAE